MGMHSVQGTPAPLVAMLHLRYLGIPLLSHAKGVVAGPMAQWRARCIGWHDQPGLLN